jgi:hypothetical protein
VGARPTGRARLHERQGMQAKPAVGMRLGQAGWAGFGVKKEKWPMAG